MMEQLLEFIGYFKPMRVSAALFLAQFCFSALGATIRLMIDVAKRNEESQHTPKQFDWGFFIRDNAWRVLMGLPSMYGMLRFLDWLMPMEVTPPVLLLGSLIIGLFSDLIVRILDKGLRSKINSLASKYFPNGSEKK